MFAGCIISENKSSQPDMPDGMFPASSGFIKTYLCGIMFRKGRPIQKKILEGD